MEPERPTKRPKSSKDSFYNNPMLSDITLQIDGGQTVYGHKVTLSSKSGFFRNAFTGRFKEAEDDRMNLVDDENPRAIVAMLRHIYDLPYEASPPSTLLFYSQVFVIADKYDVPTLLKKVADDFESLAENTWESNDFIDAITKLYQYENMADQSLHNCIKEYCRDNLEDFLDNPKFVTMLETTAALTTCLLRDMSELQKQSLRPGEHSITRCIHCKDYYYPHSGSDVGTCHICDNRNITRRVYTLNV